MATILTPPAIPVGLIKQFASGEPYEVMESLRPEPNGDWWVKIVMVKTGEEAEMLLTSINDDPDAD